MAELVTGIEAVADAFGGRHISTGQFQDVAAAPAAAPLVRGNECSSTRYRARGPEARP